MNYKTNILTNPQNYNINIFGNYFKIYVNGALHFHGDPGGVRFATGIAADN